MYYVNLYLTNKAYGGPEEGGWWYGTGETVRSFAFFTERCAQRCLSMVEKIAKGRNVAERRRLPSSVLCNGYYQVFIQATPAADYPTERPHYE